MKPFKSLVRKANKVSDKSSSVSDALSQIRNSRKRHPGSSFLQNTVTSQSNGNGTAENPHAVDSRHLPPLPQTPEPPMSLDHHSPREFVRLNSISSQPSTSRNDVTPGMNAQPNCDDTQTYLEDGDGSTEKAKVSDTPESKETENAVLSENKESGESLENPSPTKSISEDCIHVRNTTTTISKASKFVLKAEE